MSLRIDPAAPEPLFEQIGQRVKESVAAGLMAPGDRLPSVRELARELAINPNTVARAYEALERDGVILRRQGSGCFVTGQASPLRKDERRKRISEQARRLVDARQVLELLLTHHAERLLLLADAKQGLLAFLAQIHHLPLQFHNSVPGCRPLLFRLSFLTLELGPLRLPLLAIERVQHPAQPLPQSLQFAGDVLQLARGAIDLLALLLHGVAGLLQAAVKFSPGFVRHPPELRDLAVDLHQLLQLNPAFLRQLGHVMPVVEIGRHGTQPHHPQERQQERLGEDPAEDSGDEVKHGD